LRRLWIDGERHERGYAIEWSVLNAKGKKVGGRRGVPLRLCLGVGRYLRVGRGEIGIYPGKN